MDVFAIRGARENMLLYAKKYEYRRFDVVIIYAPSRVRLYIIFYRIPFRGGSSMSDGFGLGFLFCYSRFR